MNCLCFLQLEYWLLFSTIWSVLVDVSISVLFSSSIISKFTWNSWCLFYRFLALFLALVHFNGSNVPMRRTDRYMCTLLPELLYHELVLKRLFWYFRQCWFGDCLWKIFQSMLPQHYWSWYVVSQLCFPSPKLCRVCPDLLMFVGFQVILISSRTCLIIKPWIVSGLDFGVFILFFKWRGGMFCFKASVYVVNRNASLETKLCFDGIFGSAVLDQMFLYSSLYAYPKIWILISFIWNVFFSI